MRVFNNTQHNRVEFLDERFYKEGDNYYPSVTTVLDAYPKGERFMQWLKDVGSSADDIVGRAAEQGTNVHAACELLIKGENVEWKDYTIDEWKMIIKFKDFWTTAKPTNIEAVEHNLVVPKIGVGGTIDLVCIIDGQRWLIDLKTSGAIYDNHFIQIAVYAAMWNETYPDERIDRIGALHLRSLTKGPDKAGNKLQGHGWKVDEPTESPADLFQIWLHVFALWRRMNPHAKPMNLVLPSSLKLDINVQIKQEAKKVVALPFE
jgi:hypothetical protein